MNKYLPGAIAVALILAVAYLAATLWPRSAGAQTPPQQASQRPALIAICTEAVTRIHAVQGAGASSPLVGETVTVQGVVTGDFQAADRDAPFNFNLGGYFLQELDEHADDDVRTSEGIFVIDPTPRAVDVSVGDLVRLTGRVQEADGLTRLERIRDVTVCASGYDMPTAVELRLPVEELRQLEASEGMLVTFPQELVITEYFNFDRFGEVVLAAPQPGMDRPYQPSLYVDPTDSAFAGEQDLILRSRIVLDDGRSVQNPDPARHPNGGVFDLRNLFRGGDRVSNVTGILDYAFGSYRIQPTTGADHRVTNPRPLTPPDVGGDVRVAVFNVLNYFDTLTPAGNVCGPRGGQACRGADDANEFERQRAKIVAALSAIDAHVVGLIEIENDADQSALRDLVAALNREIGSERYAYVDTGPIGPDVIRQAIIYQPAVVQPVGEHAVLAGAFLDPNSTGAARNRPALAQTFAGLDGEGAFTVVVNHFKSKGETCVVPGDDDSRQGNCNLTRTFASELLLEWLEHDPTGAGNRDFLVLGDFNGYAREDPIRTIKSGGDGILGTDDDYIDLLAEHSGLYSYTFVFDGQFGYLDYAFASNDLAPRVTGAAAWHINADESDLLDYDTSFKLAAQDQIYAPDPFRSSDHDPVIVGLRLTR
ncbi:MAG: ExeM/NucH family extracellular endonuclease [Trueperaceae bacterium]|nr:ExeM/NucH family extracellular endonuclease [Trueperaceae bacterium]